MNITTRRFIVWLVALGVSIDAPVSVSAQAAGRPPNLDAYRNFALRHEGDVARGAALFANDQKLLCAKCHSIDGSASKAGPDLIAAGDKFGRRELIDAVLLPSAKIATGYGTTIIETKAGEEIQGVIKQAGDAEVKIMGADGRLLTIATADIKAQRGSSVSLMPDGQQSSLTVQEFCDLIDYLVSLKQPESALRWNRGMPGVIPELATPVEFRPYFKNEFKLPPGKVLTGLTSMRQIPGGGDDFLVLHQRGMMWRITRTAAGEEKTGFLDLTAEIFSDRGPNGLQDAAFHPKFRENRKYYLQYQIIEDGKVTTILVEREFAADFKRDSGKPARRILKIVSIAEDHSGGCLMFGKDGYLYMVMGDTGPQMDPNGHAQNLSMLLGKVLRLDVDHAEGGNAYAAPRDNPFAGKEGARPEIWAYGFRNPWRFSFDRLTGEMWLADVGQDRVEEVDIVHAGGNYGWNVYEAFEPFSNQYRKEGQEYVSPVFAYRRRYGASVTGGYVFRGDKNSSFYGVYICGDYVSKKMLGVAVENGELKTARQIGVLPQPPVSFEEDEAGNIYAVGFDGVIYKVELGKGRFE